MQKKILTLLVASSAVSGFVFAESPRGELWINAFTADAEARPQDVIAELEKISALAADAKSWSEYALAAEMRADALSQIAGKNAALARVRALRESLAAAPSPEAKIFLEAKLAWAFADLAQNFRAGTLRGNDDAETATALPEDIAEWSDTQLRQAAAAHYENVLAQGVLLKKIPLAAVRSPNVFSAADREKLLAFIRKNARSERPEDANERLNDFVSLDILKLNDAPAAEFPTLYDFIARDAEKFFSELAQAAFPQEKSALPAPEILLAPTPEFLESVPAADVSENAPLLRALNLLRERTQFHAADADASALARVTLDRILFTQKIFGEKATDALETALKNFIADYAYFPISAEAAATLAEIYISQNREPEAHEIAEKAVEKFGNALNANACKSILARLEKVELSPLKFPGAWNHAISTPVFVKAKNVKQIRFRAVPADWRDYLKKEHNRTNRLSQKEISALLDAPDAVLWNAPLEQFHDFRTHDYNLELAAGTLTPGFYFVFAAPDNVPFEGEHKDNKLAPIPVWVGDIAVVTEHGGWRSAKLNADGELAVRVVNSVTGAPIEGAVVSAWNKARWGGERISVPSVKTDAFGSAKISGLKKDRDPLVLVEAEFPAKQNDSAESGAVAGTQIHAVSLENFAGNSGSRPNDDEGLRVALFTDREIFRPGQKISFKGVYARSETPKNQNTAEVFPGKKVRISLARNQNGKRLEVASTEAWTNGFGAFAGTLDIPQEILLGAWNLEAEAEGGPNNLNHALIRVEEYRKPKSEIKIAGAETPQILGGNASATITGTSFTGAPLDGAKVHWSVKTFDDETYTRKEIASGEGFLDASGKLKISWKTERRKLDENSPRTQKLSLRERRAKELNLSTNFDVSAEIIDSNGETVSAKEGVWVSNQSFDLCAEHDGVSFGGDVPVTFRRSEKTQTPVPVKIEIFRLKEPEKLLRTLTQNSDSVKNLEIGEKVFSAECRTVPADEKSPSLTIPAGTLAPGRYQVISTCRDDFSQEIRTESSLCVLDAKAEKFPLNRAFFATWKTTKPEDKFRVGETAEIVWGSAIPGARAFVEIRAEGTETRSFYTEAGRTQQTIRIPVTEEMLGKSVSVTVSQTAAGTFFCPEFHISVPVEKTLKIEATDFNSELVPGTPETWTFKITRPDGSPAAETEVLATLYDVSAESLMYLGNPDLWARQKRKFDPRRALSFFRLYSSAEATHSRHFHPGKTSYYADFLLPAWAYSPLQYNAPWGAPRVVYSAGSGVAVKQRMNARAESALATAPIPVLAAEPETADESVEGDGIPEGKTEQAQTKSAFPMRKNLQETAFFYPFLKTNENGIVSLQFVAPEALTRWRLRLFAHDKKLNTGTLEKSDIFTSKDLMVQPDAPRFLREGDEIKFPVKITNRGDAELAGTLRLDAEFFAADGTKIDEIDESPAEQNFAVPAKSSKTFFREIKVPSGVVSVNFRAAASDGKISDGETASLPVLPREIVVTESRTALVRPNSEATLSFEKLATAGATENSPRSRSFTLDVPTDAHDNILLALPYVAEQAQEFESSDSILYRLYANALAKTICDANPQIGERIERWKQTCAKKFDSPLAANAKNTPYAGIAAHESEQRRNVEIFFNENQINSAIRRALDELRERSREHNRAGWSWFPGTRCGVNEQITREILVGLGRLRERVSDQRLKTELTEIARPAFAAQQIRLQKRFRSEDGKPQKINAAVAQDLYLISLFPDLEKASPEAASAREHYLSEAKKSEFWTTLPRMSQAHLALALWRSGEKDIPAKILESLRQRAICDEQLGMYWNDLTTLPLWLPQFSPIETQAAMIEAFSEIAQDKKAVEEMKIWLLTRKQTHAWKSSRASANAVYALLCENGETRAPENATAQIARVPVIALSDSAAKKLVPGTQIPAPELAAITAKNTSNAPGFVAAHWTFSQPISAVQADAPENGFSVKKSVFKRERAANGKFVLRPARLEILKPGDEIVVRLTVRADRDFEFVCLKDFRASGCEPAEALSGWRCNNLLWYYGEPRDTETRFYFDRLPSGTHVFEYTQRVRTSGLYSSGFAEIRSLYAPEFSAHSSSESLVSR